MPTLDLVLGIIRTLLDLELERVKHLTPEQAEAHWQRWEKVMEPWTRLVDKLSDL